MAKTILTPAERFMSKVEMEPNTGCWLWTGARMKTGYGRFYDRRITRGTALAHRAAWTIYFGSPAGMHVCHRCDTPSCVNPEHLFLSDNFGNHDDMSSKGRGTKSAAGLPYGVRKDWKKFQVQIQHNGKRHYGGSFDTPEEASRVAAELKKRLRG